MIEMSAVKMEQIAPRYGNCALEKSELIVTAGHPVLGIAR